MKLTVILNGRGGELDRTTVETRGDDVTSDDLAAGQFTLGDLRALAREAGGGE